MLLFYLRSLGVFAFHNAFSLCPQSAFLTNGLTNGYNSVAFLVIRYFFILEINRPMRSMASTMFFVDVA